MSAQFLHYVRTTSHEGCMSHEGDVVRTYVVRTLCGHISPGIYICTISALFLSSVFSSGRLDYDEYLTRTNSKTRNNVLRFYNFNQNSPEIQKRSSDVIWEGDPFFWRREKGSLFFFKKGPLFKNPLELWDIPYLDLYCLAVWGSWIEPSSRLYCTNDKPILEKSWDTNWKQQRKQYD